MSTCRLWTDAELAAAHALVSSVMTPAAPPVRCPICEPVAYLVTAPMTPKHEAFEGRERQRRRTQYRRKNPRPPIGSRDTAGIWRKGNGR
jgi:hypothetical protein